MAILPNCPGLEVNVLIQGQKAVEYHDEHEEGRTPNRVVRYIEAVSGADFGVRFELKQDVAIQKQQFQFKAEAYIDGAHVDGVCIPDRCFVYEGGYRISKYTFTGVKHTIGSEQYKRPFKFSEVQTDDQAKLPSTAILKDTKQIGEIRIEFTKGIWQYVEAKTTSSFAVKEPTENLSEKVFKGRAISHQTAYGPPVRIEKSASCVQIRVDPKPFAIFVFRYKSKDALKAEGVIPRSPTPVPLEDRPVETLSAEELQELVRRQKNTLAKVKSERALKRERNSQVQAQYASSDTEDGIEEIERPAKFRKVVETIDLSGE